MNGKQQTDAMARLAGNQFSAGDLVDTPLGRAQVTAILPGGWLRIRTSLVDEISVKAALCRPVTGGQRHG